MNNAAASDAESLDAYSRAVTSVDDLHCMLAQGWTPGAKLSLDVMRLGRAGEKMSLVVVAKEQE